MNVYKTTKYISTLNVEHPQTPDEKMLIIPMGDCFLYNFWLDEGVYEFNDGHDKFVFAVEYTRYYDDACRKVHFIQREHKQVFKKILYENPKIGLYKNERKTLRKCNKKAISEWLPLGPNNRQALYVGLQDLDKPENVQKTCWKHMNGLDLKKPKGRFDKIQQEIVKDIINHGYYVLDKENDVSDSAELDVKSTLDDYDNYNYESNEIIVNLDDNYDYESGYYGW